MNRIVLSAATGFAVLFIAPVHAQDIASCRGISDNLERLTCYDNIPLAGSAPVDVDAIFEEFLELISYKPTPSANGPYGAEVEWRFSESARDWLRATYNDFFRRDISLMQEGAKMENCSLHLYQTWRIRGGYGTNGRSALESDAIDRQGLVARTYSIMLDAVDIEVTRPSALGTVTMERDAVIPWFEHVRVGWADAESLNPFPEGVSLDSFSVEERGFIYSEGWEMVRFDMDRTVDIRMGVAYRPEDSIRIRDVFLQLAEACQQ